MAKYSIIIPVYNSSKTLERCINSVLNQNYDDWELIIIDDGSTDNSVEIIKKFTNNNDKIKFFSQKNSGPGRARNFGIEKSNSDYICFMDADDYMEDNYLQLVDSKINAEKCDVLFLDLILEKENGKIDNILKFKQFEGFSKEKLISCLVMGKLPWGAYNKVVKSEIIKKCKFSELSVGEEIVYTFDVINNSNSFACLNEPVYHYIHNENGQHKKGGIDPWKLVMDKIENHLVELHIEKKYKNELSILAVKSVIIAVYRCFLSFNYKEAVEKIKKIIGYYQEKYNFLGVNFKDLSKINGIILFLIKNKQFRMLYLLCKIKNKK